MPPKKQAEQSPNTVLWNSVFTSDPSSLKKVSKGGYSFHAIDAYAQFQKATEVFGPFGIGWGLDSALEKYDHFTVGNMYTMFQYSGVLWYRYGSDTGIVPIASSIQIDAHTKSTNAYRTDEDYLKKVRTDALTKGLSMLGFNADVFLGYWDGNKYVEQVETPGAQHIATSPFLGAAPQPAPQPAPTQAADPYTSALNAINAAGSKAVLDEVAATIGEAMARQTFTQEQSSNLTSAYHAAIQKFNA